MAAGGALVAALAETRPTRGSLVRVLCRTGWRGASLRTAGVLAMVGMLPCRWGPSLPFVWRLDMRVSRLGPMVSGVTPYGVVLRAFGATMPRAWRKVWTLGIRPGYRSLAALRRGRPLRALVAGMPCLETLAHGVFRRDLVNLRVVGVVLQEGAHVLLLPRLLRWPREAGGRGTLPAWRGFEFGALWHGVGVLVV